MAGISHAAFRGRRPDSPGAAVQEPPRTDAGDSPVARADLELRSSPPDKRLVLERLVYDLAAEPKSGPAPWASAQLSFEG